MAKTFKLISAGFSNKAVKLGIFPKFGIPRAFSILNDGSEDLTRNFRNSIPTNWRVKKPKNHICEFQLRKCYEKNFYGTKSPDDSNFKESVCSDKSSKWPSGVKANFKFHSETEAALNEQIKAEFTAFYYYLSMASYFGRVDVALPGCESFFTQMHHEEHGHALKLMNYIKLRGGSVMLCPIQTPDDQDWKSPLNAFKTALLLEMEVTEKLVSVNKVAEKHGDLNASDFIITYYMQDQMKSINEIARLVTILSGIGDQSLARFIFDKELLENYVMSDFNVLKDSSVFEYTEESLKKVKKSRNEEKK
ncbi:soma ferritin-like [Belonocnema kinseyi]|uniref:soma ferritin-like n=1 Tax=Belonocnema kinseyi TaxID=2817044 RepID=UPI00143D5B32|nr:soma ferritin-like [Belonocnema kinseyi]